MYVIIFTNSIRWNQYWLYIVIREDIFYEKQEIRVITKLPNSEQSNKGKVKTHKYINRENRSTTGKLKTVMTLTWYRHF